ncbi:uncharacterized protein BKA78DRAFT_357272 [Phyllosticta capitalensis]|uniref:uncharacterized protein n=1 Tax=Phyllosticta capitalensis TaxID=121624 RepID=UPI00312D6EB3
MAFSMGAAAGPQARQSNELDEIETEGIQFKLIAAHDKASGTNKLKLFPQPWPTDRLPPSYANLLAVASRKGIVAAAGPDSLVVASTEKLRQKLGDKNAAKDGEWVAFQSDLSIPMPRLSQVAFTADEQHLVVSAEEGGGLAIHDVGALMQGNKDSAFQLGTENVAVRCLAPNPMPELAENIAVVLTGGQLMIANLKEQRFISGQNAAVLKDGATCVAWSNKGKQLTAGLQDGTAVQMKPDGSPQAIVPRPPTLEGDQYISSISWLSNDEFLIGHTAANSDTDMVPDTTFHYISREKGTQNYSFHKLLEEPCLGFNQQRLPPQYFICRLRGWKPSLDDLLLAASTAGDKVGIITKSSKALSREQPVVNAYTQTTIGLDSCKADFPSSAIAPEDMADPPSLIGMSLDLSASEKVYRPVAKSDLEESSTPLPALFVLNYEGVLGAWWVVYGDSVEAGTPFDGLTAANGALQSSQTQVASQPPASSSPWSNSGASAPAFGQSSFGNSAPKPSPFAQSGGSAFGSPAKPAFGQPSQPAFGQTSFGPSKPALAFGSPSMPAKSPFGQTAFGSPSMPGSNFGQSPSQPQQPFSAAKESPFSKFGQQAGASPFASAGQTGQSPFGGLNKASSPAFAGTGSGSTFGQASTLGGAFGKPAEPAATSSFGAPAPQTGVFGQKAEEPKTQESEMGDVDDQPAGESAPKEEPSSFGLGMKGFKLESTFKGDGTAKDDLPKPAEPSGGFGLGAFGKALGEASKEPEKSSPFANLGKTPQAEKSSPFANFGKASQTEEKSSPFGKPSQPAESTSLFGNLGKTPQKTEQKGMFSNLGKPSTLFGNPPSSGLSFPPKTAEPESPAEEDAPLPPDFTKTKVKEEPEAEDAPLPPDFTKAPAAKETPEDAPLPPDPEEQSTPTSPQDAPLPPDFTAKPAETEEDLPPIAGSPPVEVEIPESPEGDKPTWSFGSVPSKTESRDSPKPQSPSKTAVPPTPDFRASTTPAGMPKTYNVFSPPKKEPIRSPSPVRAASTSLLSPGPRRHQPISLPPPTPLKRQTSRPPPEEPDFGEWAEDDRQFEDTQARLSSSPPAKTKLGELYAHQDYVGKPGSNSIGGSMEQLYRDIQDMVDTVGLNALELAGFIKGHNTLTHERSREDLDIDVDGEENDWVLAETTELAKIEDSLAQNLEAGRVDDVRRKISELIHLSKEVSQLRRRIIDVRKSIEARRDPEKQRQIRATPLSEEQSAQQIGLRNTFAETQKLLSQAEEGIVILKAKLASAAAAKGSNGASSSSHATPTAEAVESTIRRMTAMVEAKSGDLDVIEAKMRKAKILGAFDEDDDVDYEPAPADDPEDITAGLTAMTLRSSMGHHSRESSPATWATPPSAMRRNLRGSTPGGTGRSQRLLDWESGSPLPIRASIEGGDVGAGLVTKGEVKAFVRKTEKKRFVAAKVKDAVAARGVKVTRFVPQA